MATCLKGCYASSSLCNSPLSRLRQRSTIKPCSYKLNQWKCILKMFVHKYIYIYICKKLKMIINHLISKIKGKGHKEKKPCGRRQSISPVINRLSHVNLTMTQKNPSALSLQCKLLLIVWLNIHPNKTSFFILFWSRDKIWQEKLDCRHVSILTSILSQATSDSEI